ncbi:atherin [Spinachia spinachia]
MSEPSKYREWILATIDSLRSRKARPDLERICRMVRRRHGSDPDRTRTELEKLIQEQTVLKVSYKGSISYRNAAKVQRKSRKKSEFTAAGGGAEVAAAARERSKRDPLNHHGDSAHSFTDQGGDSEPSPDPRAPPASACAAEQQLKPACSPSSGNGLLVCAVGSGCEEEKASAPRDKGAGPRGAGTNTHDGGDASGAQASPGEMEPCLSGGDTRDASCPASVRNLPRQHHHQQQQQQQQQQLQQQQQQQLQQQRGQKQTESLEPKLRVGVGGGGGGGGGGREGGTGAAGDHANSELGARLVASVRSLSGGLSGGSAAPAAAGHTQPLGLEEMLGYLSGQERLSEEKRSHGKGTVVTEREVARGRLRRTRCGNITLPPRGARRSALRGAHAGRKPPAPSHREDEPMETASEEEEREEEEEEEVSPSSDEEARGLSPVAMTTEPGLSAKGTDVAIQTSSERESPQHGAEGTCVLDSLTRTTRLPVQGESLSQHNSEHTEDGAIVSDQLHIEAQMRHDRINPPAPDFNRLETQTGVGVSSCLLTPTASPRDSGVSEDRGVNGAGGFLKSEGASGGPVDWTVSDVVSYFTAAGFPEQASAFKTQEIDGKSLLLMQRNDVLTGLSIRLGPALKIYERHVKVLQKTHFEDEDCE